MKTFLITAAAIAVGIATLAGMASAMSVTDRDAESKKAIEFCAQFHIKDASIADNCVFAKYNDIHTEAELTEMLAGKGY